MIAKIKKQSLLLVALYLGWTGYGATQPAEESALDLTVPEPLPEVSAEDMPLRLKDQVIAQLIDPFRLGQMKVAPVVTDDERQVTSETVDDDATVLELNSTMRLPSGPIAFINRRRIAVGESIVSVANGPSPVLKSVRGPQIEIEYLEEIYVLDTHSMPRLVLKKGAAVIVAAANDDSMGLEDGDGESGQGNTPNNGP
jgi:hypothetical protein